MTKSNQSSSNQAFPLPDNLPIPVDDGACDHLTGMGIPSLTLPSTEGSKVDLSRLTGITVVYCYPRTGVPGRSIQEDWNAIPGARGCTPQTCAFKDHHADLQRLNARVFGLSTQSSTYQREAVERLHLPFPILSDEGLELVHALKLPTFEYDALTMIKRLTMIIVDGRISKVFYPVFPPDKNAQVVLDWLTDYSNSLSA